jgi:polyphenol oxidase
MWHSAPNIASKHGFSDRIGGVSEGAYAQLNLSSNVGDLFESVAINRRLALNALGLSEYQLARLRQVHSSEVVTLDRDSDLTHLPMADALVTRLRGVVLVIESADCYPVLLEDAQAGVIGAAHCGWRGTAGRLLERVLEAMRDAGARVSQIRAALGPGICAEQYVVGADVLVRFAQEGFGQATYVNSSGGLSRSGIEQYYVNLAAANRWLLEAGGVLPEHIWAMDRCSTEADFFSHRRDHGTTGRMWSVIAQ